MAQLTADDLRAFAGGIDAGEGHAKAERPLVDNPDRVIPAKVTTCGKCGTDLSQVEPAQTIRRQVTELPEIKPVVMETRQDVVVCPCCRTEQRGALPEGLEAERHFGPRLEGLVTYLHHEQHVGFERLQTLLQTVLGIASFGYPSQGDGQLPLRMGAARLCHFGHCAEYGQASWRECLPEVGQCDGQACVAFRLAVNRVSSYVVFCC